MTKYRYYSSSQIPIFKMIYFKKLAFNNAAIKSHLQNLDHFHTLNLINTTLKKTKKEIHRLKCLEKNFREIFHD